MSERVERATEPTWTLPPVSPTSARRRRLLNVLGVIALGIAVGELGLALGALELRWIVYLFAVALFVTVISIVPQRERLLTAMFLLSLQIDVYARFLYGRAGTPGIELPLSVCMGLALWAQLALASTTPFVWFGRLQKPILAVLATTALSLLTTSERFAGVSRLFFELQLVLVYALAINIVRRRNGVWDAMSFLAFTLGLQATICLIQSRLGVNFSLLGEVSDLGGVPRPGGTVSTNPAGFASFVMPLIMVVSARFVSRDRAHRGRADWLLALLGVTAVILTFTRAAWGGLVLGLAYITVVGIRRRYITPKQLAVIAGALVVVSLAAAPLIRARLEEAPLGASYDERANLNRIAIGVIAQHPLFGVGAGGYDFQFKQYLPPGADAFWLAGVHNEYLMRAAETGIPGGLAFVWLLLVGFSQARRLSRSGDPAVRIFGLGWSAGLLALSWQMYWVPWRGFSYNSILWLFLGLAEGLEQVDHHQHPSQPQRRALTVAHQR